MKRILWFSPMPPARTDIANYSARLAPYLREHAEVQFCYPDDAPHDGALPAKKISQLSRREVNKAHLCVYNLGNNAEFHGQIYEWNCLHPGLVVLHERAIHQFFLGHLGFWDGTLDESSVCRYLETMIYWYGERGYRFALDVCHGKKNPIECVDEYPLYEIALGNALGVLTHNPLISKEIRERFPLLPVIDLPLPYSVKKGELPRQTIIKEKFRFVAFGFIGANRRLAEFVQAWAESPWRDRFTLDIAGTMFERERFDAVVRQSGLGNRISNHGFVDDAHLDLLLRQADLAINLRYPTMGEASGSQLRIWSNGLASVVTDIGWYGQLPDETVFKVRPEHQRKDLLNLFRKIVHGEADLAGVADAGRRQLKSHAVDQYVGDLMKWYDREQKRLGQLWSKRKQIRSLAREQAKLVSGDSMISPPQFLFDVL